MPHKTQITDICVSYRFFLTIFIFRTYNSLSLDNFHRVHYFAANYDPQD